MSSPNMQSGQCQGQREGWDKAHLDILFTNHKYSLTSIKVIMNDVLAPELAWHQALKVSPSLARELTVAAWGISPECLALWGPFPLVQQFYSWLILSN